MTFPLGELMESIRIGLDARLPEEIPERDQELVSWYTGERFARANTRRPPSYCWFPGDIAPAPPFKGDMGQNVAVATGTEVAMIHSWGANEEQGWTLRHNVISVAKDMYGADCAYLGCQRWEPDDRGYGGGYVTKLSFDIPVIGQRLAIAVPTTLNHTAYIVINGVATQAAGDLP